MALLPKKMKIINSFNLTDEYWNYGNRRIIVPGPTLNQPRKGMEDRVEMYSGAIPKLVEKLEPEGYKHANIDGGRTIQSFFNLNLKLINEMKNCESKAFANDFIQDCMQVKH